MSDTFPITALRLSAWVSLATGVLLAVVFLGQAASGNGAAPTSTGINTIYALLSFFFGFVAFAFLQSVAIGVEALQDIRARMAETITVPTIPTRTGTRAGTRSTSPRPSE